MKIGIITLPLHVNYGGILQAYALQTALRNLGYTSEIIQRKKVAFKLPLWKKIPVYAKRVIKKYLLCDSSQIILLEEKYNREYDSVSKNTQDFICKYISLREINSFEDISEADFGCYIVGSDQIWRPRYFKNIENAFFFFAKGWNVKRLSYAASFGTDDWEYSNDQARLCSSLLTKFNAVSVRELSGVDICSKYLYYDNAKHVLDPTMLLTCEDYLQLLCDDGSKSEGDLLTYILDETNEKTQVVDEIAEKNGFKPFSVNANPEDINASLEERIVPPLENWIKGFRDAKFVITDSFHACVFSILFHKPFIVYGNKARGLARFQSLLSMFDLSDRLITSVADFKKDSMNEIDWVKVDAGLEKYKNISETFLLENLRHEK